MTSLTALSNGTGTHWNVNVAHVIENIVKAVNHCASLVTIVMELIQQRCIG